MAPPLPPVLNERGSMIVPVDRAALPAYPEHLQLGALALRRKEEHHFTVFNYAIGKLIKKAAALGDGINAIAAAHDWSFRLAEQHFHLVKDGEAPLPPLHTVIVLVEADLRGFFAHVRELVVAGGEFPQLAAALEQPGPPHITLYTSDPTGKAGIGINTVAELVESIARATAASPAPGLRAYRLAPGVVVPAA
jgi:hypothetical protein